MDKIYDILVIGGGPAGITSAIYARRAGLDVAIIEKFVVGGQIALIGEIENYPAFPKVQGDELSRAFFNHAKSLDIPFIYDEIIDYNLDDDIKIVKGKKQSYQAYAVILAMGSHSKELNIEGEKQLIGRGVSYCALCDGNFFKNQDVAVVGSGDSAISDALYLSNICRKVYVLTRDKLKLNNYSEQDINERENIVLLKGANSTKIEGEDKVRALDYEQDEQSHTLSVSAIFVAIGRKPDTEKLKDKIELTEKGFIITNDRLQTSVAGVFACGDVRNNTIKQIATAVGEGAIAGNEASKFARILKHKTMIQ